MEEENAKKRKARDPNDEIMGQGAGHKRQSTKSLILYILLDENNYQTVLIAYLLADYSIPEHIEVGGQHPGRRLLGVIEDLGGAHRVPPFLHTYEYHH